MTPFGRLMRDLRIEKGLRLKDVADLLEVTPAYLSALEHGKKGVPNLRIINRLVETLKLKKEQVMNLQQAAASSNTKINIPSKAVPLAFETANSFARKLAGSALTEQQLREIKEILDE